MKNTGRIILSIVGVVLSIALLGISAVLTEEKIINTAAAIAFIAVSVVLVWIAISYAAKVDYETGVYECRKCGHTFKPTFKAYILGVHTLTTRYLKCPECEGKSWCKRKSVEKEKNHD